MLEPFDDPDTTCTEEIICPYCGHVHSGSWDFHLPEDGSPEKIQCEECEKEFFADVELTVTYSSSKLEDE